MKVKNKLSKVINKQNLFSNCHKVVMKLTKDKDQSLKY